MYASFVCGLIFLIWCIRFYFDTIEQDINKLPFYIRPFVRLVFNCFVPEQRRLSKLSALYQQILDELTGAISQKAPVLYGSPTGDTHTNLGGHGTRGTSTIKIGDLVRDQAKTPVVRPTLEKISLHAVDIYNEMIAFLNMMAKDRNDNKNI